MFSLSYTFIGATVILALICRFNFGTEVMQHLRANNREEAGDAGLLTDEQGNLKRLTLANRSQPFLVSLPGQIHVDNPPKRWASLSSATSSSSSGSSKARVSRMPIMAAQPGVIKITPPVPTATPTTLTPADSVGQKSKLAWKYGGRPFWGKLNKRHESAMSFGHMDPSRLTLSASMLAPEPGRNIPVQLPTDPRAPSPLLDGPRVDSVGSIYSTQSKKTRLFLVTAL
jgi:hypothetical protein